MPTYRSGFPYLYASKPGGWFYEVEDSPANSNFADWPSEISFNGDGSFIMRPNGPTDFGLGKNISGFSDSIGGCSMSFTDTAARGYAYKADDARDLEIMCVCTFENITQGEGFSISACTGRHTSDQCCEGFAYMFNVDPNASPCSFRFRKEMWHVSYHDSPEGRFTHSIANFKLVGHGKVGLCFCRYNKPNDPSRVVLEGWVNPAPDANKNNWVMVKRIEDFNGNGWGDDGDQCDGEPDQYGPWSNAQNRFKTNSTSGSVTFEKVSIREIDPSRALDDTGVPGDGDPGNPPPPPPPTGGGTQPSIIKPIITYINVKGETQPTTGLALIGLQRITRAIARNMVDMMVNPDANAKFGAKGWCRDTSNNDITDSPCTNTDQNVVKVYPDGLAVTTYWSNAENFCSCPGITHGVLGTDADDVTYHGGRVLKNPRVCLIFWGAEWNTRTISPTKEQIIVEIRDKLLGTDKQYFNKIQEYSSPGVPIWGTTGMSAGGSTTPDPPPTSGNTLTIPLPKYRDSNDSRPILPVQMKLPNGQWSNDIQFNFDTGATYPTYIPLQLLADFGYGPNGSESGSPQNVTIRIPGLNGEYTIPVQVQDKSHYDLQRSQPPPIRYPLVRIRDLLQYMSFVLTKDNVIIRTAATTIPELSAAGKITLPNMQSRVGTPTSGWQWMHVDFVNPNTNATVDDWFGLNTGDQRIIVRAGIADDINLSLRPPLDNDPDENDATCSIRFKEATPSTLISNNTIVVRDETADFGSGGGPRSFGSGFSFLNKYKMVLHGSSLQRELIPV